ncbi:MAG: tRNA pseudouridine(55) synthase TruB [Chloroflexi bacterium]|nr:MAG: tRNA pseudouridine(55) synthase TruB [Chloroflexota bacterium]
MGRRPITPSPYLQETNLSDPIEPVGLIVIDKPSGMTSHDVVARVRRMLRMKRVGHGGALDPFATGVLPIAVGRATRILQYVQGSSKTYEVVAHLGEETDSGDIDGVVVASADIEVWPGPDVVGTTLERFVGEIEQVPPALSAIKVHGVPLHRRVRAGEQVVVPSRRVSIYSIDVVQYVPPELQLRVDCSSGTYIRALVRDIGRVLGCYAYCTGLRRTRTGPFTIEQSWTLERLAEHDLCANWRQVMLPMDAAVLHLPAIELGQADADRWYHGRSLSVSIHVPEGGIQRVRVYAPKGKFAGIGEVDLSGGLIPQFVIPAGDAW